MSKIIYVPADQDCFQLGEYKIDEIMNLINGEPGDENVHNFEIEQEQDSVTGRIGCNVNLGSNRYHVFKKNLTCECCGIQATRCFLELDVQNTKEQKRNVYHFNFYAESGDPIKNTMHLVLMIKNNIVAPSNGGSDDMDNQRTLCYNCNCLKAIAELPLDQLRLLFFPAHRAYSSSIALTKVKEELKPYYDRLDRNKYAVINVTEALKVVKDERVAGLVQKISNLQADSVLTEAEIKRIERETQINGIAPPVETWKFGKNKNG